MPVVRNIDAGDRLRGIVASVLEMDIEDVESGASFYDDLGADSLEKVEITARIENDFEVTITAEEAAAMHCVDDAVAVLDGKGVLPGAGTAPPEPASAVDLVRRLVGAHLDAGRGNRPAYLDPDVGEVSYRRLHQAARGYAGALRSRGVEPGSRGLIVAEDSVATVAAVLGLWWHGCVPVPVSPLLTDAEIAYIAGDCTPAVVHLDTTAARQQALDAGLPPAVRTTGDAVREGLRSGASTGGHQPEQAVPPAAVPAGQEALVQYTSGSTGVQKGVRHSAAGLVAMLDGFGPVTGLTDQDRVLSTARMSFGYGFGSSVLCPLDAGAATVLIRGRVDVQVVVAALRRHQPTVLCSVPRLYVPLLDQAGDDGGPAFPSLRLCLTAGEKCPAELEERIRTRLGVDLMTCLGATEVMHIVIATPPGRPMPGSLGFPVPGVTVTVRDGDGRPVPDGTEGRLHVAGPTVALGYLNRPDAEAETFADGGVYTNDVVRRTAAGDLEYLCRADSILNLGGYKVIPAEIEAVIRDSEGVQDCVVVGRTDAAGLQQAVAHAVARPGADPAVVRRAVLASVRRRLAAYKRPAEVRFVDALPTTSTGKVAIFQLRERVGRS